MSQSIFSRYSQGENRVTASIIQVLRNLPVNVVEHFLRMFSDLEDEEFFVFRNQIKTKDFDTIPDAEISSDFRLRFETKVTLGNVSKEQLDGHCEQFRSASTSAKDKKLKPDILVYLTPHRLEPAEISNKRSFLKDNNIHGTLIWKNFGDLDTLIGELLKHVDIILSERDQFLLRNLQLMLDEEKLLPRKDEVVIVAASSAWPIYEELGLYVCQPNRTFRNVEWMGFYADGEIKPKIAKIISRVDGIWADSAKGPDGKPLSPNLRDKLASWSKTHPEYDGDLLQAFDLSVSIDEKQTLTLDAPIENNLKNSSGRGYAFTQGQRYVPLAKLEAKDITTKDLLEP